MPSVDVVVVTYNSRDQIRACINDLFKDPRLAVVVVDNKSVDGTPELLEGLGARVIRSETNAGFAVGCNLGWRAGAAPYVLFLNPDARASVEAVMNLTEVLENEAAVGAVGPMILETGGNLAASQRWFPSLSATFGRALFLHRVFPRRRWSFDITEPSAYATPTSPDWLSGACLLVRRSVLEPLQGFDERFFMYCEDMDLCKRIRQAGYDIRYEPRASIQHEGAASAPRARMITTMTRSRLLYAAKHRSAAAFRVERAAIALDCLTHAALTTQGPDARRGYVQSASLAIKG